jgi:hypothetical protein
MNLEKIVAMMLSPRANGFPILIALIGAMSIYLGYELFSSGVTEGGAALKISWGSDKQFEMGKGGPGLLFSAFGMGIIIFSIWKFSALRASDDRKVGIGASGRHYEVDSAGKRVYDDQQGEAEQDAPANDAPRRR